MKFIADGTGLPQQRLQDVMRTHMGLDYLYDQVLSEARQAFTLSQLDQLLDLPSGASRIALRGCQSILLIPDTDGELVQPYHASLKEFLTDQNRSQYHYLAITTHHVTILVDCLRMIVTELENDEADSPPLVYACQNWCYHLSMVFDHGGSIMDVEVLFGKKLIIFTGMSEKQLLKHWICKLGKFDRVKNVVESCGSALNSMVCFTYESHEKVFIAWLIQNGSTECEDLVQSMGQIWKVVKVSEKLQRCVHVNNSFVRIFHSSESRFLVTCSTQKLMVLSPLQS